MYPLPARCAFDSPRLRLADENRDAVDFRIVVRFDDDFMIRSDELELRIDGARGCSASRSHYANATAALSTTIAATKPIPHFTFQPWVIIFTPVCYKNQLQLILQECCRRLAGGHT